MYNLGLNSSSLRSIINKKLKRLRSKLKSKILTDTERLALKAKIEVLKEL